MRQDPGPTEIEAEDGLGARCRTHSLQGSRSRGCAYNLRLKFTVWSGLPYAVAFGAAPAVVSLAATPPGPPPVWMVLAAATLGLAAHLLNALLDVEADAATGVYGLLHRLGVPWGRGVATVLLVAASLVVVAGLGTPKPTTRRDAVFV